MHISVWSSDVCASDLVALQDGYEGRARIEGLAAEIVAVQRNARIESGGRPGDPQRHLDEARDEVRGLPQPVLQVGPPGQQVDGVAERRGGGLDDGGDD